MPIINAHSNMSEGLNAPYDNASMVTPSDSADLSYVTRSLWIGSQGNLKVTMLGGGDVTFNVTAHMELPIRVTRIWSTGTSAGDIVALW